MSVGNFGINEPPLQDMTFYILAEAVCPQCGFREQVRINKDVQVYHECNKGNVRAIVPTLELKAPRPIRPLLEKP